mgnify:CR=1 FL=1
MDLTDEASAPEGLDLARLLFSWANEQHAIIDNLTYACYRYNRAECGMSAAALAKLFPETGAAMEARYLEETIHV